MYIWRNVGVCCECNWLWLILMGWRFRIVEHSHLGLEGQQLWISLTVTQRKHGWDHGNTNEPWNPEIWGFPARHGCTPSSSSSIVMGVFPWRAGWKPMEPPISIFSFQGWRSFTTHGVCMWHFQPAPALPSGTSPWQCQHLADMTGITGITTDA